MAPCRGATSRTTCAPSTRPARAARGSGTPRTRRRAGRRRARCGARCGTPRPARRTRSSSACRSPARPRRRCAGARTRSGASPPGSWRSPARRRRSATCRASGCTARRCRARSPRARGRTRCSPAGSRPAAGAPRWPAGAAWSATTGAPSTPSAGCGCTPSASRRRPEAWLDVAIGRVRVGRAVTPWVANGALALDGARLRLGGLGRVRGTRVDARPGALEAVLARARRARARGGQRAARADRGVRLRGPGGRRAPLAELLDRRGAAAGLAAAPGPPLELATAFGGAYELGVRETDHGVARAAVPGPVTNVNGRRIEEAPDRGGCRLDGDIRRQVITRRSVLPFNAEVRVPPAPGRRRARWCSGGTRSA